jgi:hypothetical protein
VNLLNATARRVATDRSAFMVLSVAIVKAMIKDLKQILQH